MSDMTGDDALPFAAQVANIVQGYVDDKVEGLRREVAMALAANRSDFADINQRLDHLHATIGGVRDGVHERLEQVEGAANLPEHVYRQFIQAEAVRLRIVKPKRTTPESNG